MLLPVSRYSYSVTFVVTKFLTGTSGQSTIPIVGGSVGGTVIFFIILLLCVMILCVRQSHKKRHHMFDNKMIMSSAVNMTTNPSYNIAKQNIEQGDDHYDNVLQKKVSLHEEDTVKVDSNPSYEGYNTADYDVIEPDHDVTIQTNPSYNCVLKNTKTMSEDEYQVSYVETDLHSTQATGYLKVIGSSTKEGESVYDVATDDIDNVNIDHNPSYDSVSRGVKLEDNPSYNKIKHVHL